MSFQVRDLIVDVHPASPARLLLCAGTTDEQTDGCCQHPSVADCPPPSRPQCPNPSRAQCPPPSQQEALPGVPGAALSLLRSQLRQSIASL